MGYGGTPMLVSGLLGGLAGGAFLFVPFLMRGAGGGDVKMLFAAGVMTGLARGDVMAWPRVLSLLWYTSLAGLVFGVTMILLGRADTRRLRHFFRSVFDWRYDRKAAAATLPPKTSKKVSIPFSVPITIGLLLALTVG